MSAAAALLAFDLGTGGCKAGLYAADGTCRVETFEAYPTSHPAPGHAEQRPEDWWAAIVATTRRLVHGSGTDAATVGALVLSGQSLSLVPVDEAGALVTPTCPIWSDARAGAQAADFFTRVPETEWYGRTGNGFPPALYTAFKVMWLREHHPAAYARTRTVLGSKDWINLRLTGVRATDHSYASGSGVYGLLAADYDPALLGAAGIPRELLPPIVAATDVVGGLLPDVAGMLSLRPGTPVLAGGVDNACMAVGAGALSEGELFGSLGSSSWLTVTSAQPVLDAAVRPYVFTSVAPGRFHSACSTFGSGTSLAWVRDVVFDGVPDYEELMALAATSVPGAHGVLFLPTLAGGTMLEGGPDVRGSYIGLGLSHTRADLVRAVLEGVALALRRALEALRALTPIADEVLVVGGGSQSALWRQVHADALGMDVVKTSVDQQAATLGAAAVAAVGTGLWSDFERVRDAHVTEARHTADPAQTAFYDRLADASARAARAQASLWAPLAALREPGTA